MVHINYHNITHDDMNNGDGLRVVLWLSGCSHHCYNCQNPQTWNPNNGIQFDESAKKEIFNELSKDYISGITLTGGDPLYESNLNNVLSLIKEIRTSFPEKTIWLYTGYSYSDIFRGQSSCLSQEGLNNFKRREIIKLCNIVVDGEYIDEQKDLTLKFRGSKNQRVIDIQQTLKQGKVVLYCD